MLLGSEPRAGAGRTGGAGKGRRQILAGRGGYLYMREYAFGKFDRTPATIQDRFAIRKGVEINFDSKT